MRQKLRITAVIAVALAVGAISLEVLAPRSSDGPSRLYAQQAAEAEAAQEALLIEAEKLSDAFRGAAKSLRPSVVTITSLVERPLRRSTGRAPDLRDFGLPPEFRGLFPDELFEELQRREGLEPQQEPPQDGEVPAVETEKIQAGVGSGVIVSDDGFVLTNNHVVARADELQVELSDGRIYNAEVVGSDDKSDVAVLKIEASGLVPAKLGDSASIEVGDWVIAVGSPFGLDQTVTAGIISAINRQTGIITGGYEDFIQTDAAINPGNSGGPLVNLRGEVIGINTAINSRTGTNAGVGFAIPANMAKRIMSDLRTEGRVVRGFIGATLGEVTMENASQLQLPEGILRGAVIEGVVEGEPAEQGGLKAGDVVVELNGRPITSFLQLRNMVALTRPGSELTFDVYRNGRRTQVPVTVGELTDAKISKLSGRVTIESLGIVVETLTPQWAEQLGADAENGGAVVTEIQRQGRGARLGIRPGDVIIEVNGEEVSTSDQLKASMEEADEEFRMILQRGNQLLMLRSSNR